MKDSAKQIKKKTQKKDKSRYFKKSTTNNQSLYFIPISVLFIFFLILSCINLSLKYKIGNSKVYDIKKVILSDYPALANSQVPDITAESAIILDDTSKAILYEKKSQLRFSMASTTKIMTALVAMEYFRPDDIITIKSIQNEGAVVGFPIGEKIKFKDALYALLLPSANDAAYAIAENYPGGVKSFVIEMNKKARELNLVYTHYNDPSGLDDDGNYTVVKDLARLSSIAINNQTFSRIIATKRKDITSLGGINIYSLINLNRLLGTDGIVGIKTGFTQGAGEVLVTAKKLKGHLFIIIVMKSDNRFSDTQILSRFINDNVTFVNPAEYILNIQ